MSGRFDAEAHRGEILVLIENGANAHDIGRHFGFSHVTIWKALKRLGLKCHDRRVGAKPTPLSGEMRALQAMRMRERWKDPAFREAHRIGAGLQWRSELSPKWRALRRKLQRVGIDASEIRRQIDALRTQEMAA